MNLSQWTFPGKWLLPIDLIVFLVPVVSTEYSVLSFSHGVFSYPFDDTFIHLAIAKNIAFHGVWGISPHSFSSASSSVLYPLLLAGCMKLVGPATWLPLAINLMAGIALLIVVRQWLARQHLGSLGQLLTLLALIWLTPLPAIVVFGMEHTLQLLFDFLFIYSFSEAWSRMRSVGKEYAELPWTVYLYGALVTAIRYEGIFIITIACLILVIGKKGSFWQRLTLSFQLGLVSFLPIAIFGIYALFNGGYFFPNSAIVKTLASPLPQAGLIAKFLDDLTRRLYLNHSTVGGLAIQRLLILLPLSYLFFKEPLHKLSSYRCVLQLLISITLLHLLFASTFVNYRYEAYLIGCSTPIIGVLMAKFGKEWLWVK